VARYPFAAVLDEAVNELNRWNAERDMKKFFELIINTRQSAKVLMDKRKMVGEFIADQLGKYTAICQFVDDNRDNWSFLPELCTDTVHSLKSILNEPWPIDKMAPYNKMMRELSAQLEEVKKAKTSEIERIYNGIFDTLEEFATSKNVNRDCFAKRDITIMQKKSTSNILALENHINTSNDFYTQQLDIIIKHIPVTSTSPTKLPKDEGNKTLVNPTPAIKPTRNVKLNIQTTKPLKSEAEIDDYLQNLKNQLMKFIDNDYEVMVTK